MDDLDLDELERLLADATVPLWMLANGSTREAAAASALERAAPALIAAARERDRLREVIRIGGALLRLERAALGVPGGIDPEAERLRALCREVAGYMSVRPMHPLSAEADLYERLRAAGGE